MQIVWDILANANYFTFVLMKNFILEVKIAVVKLVSTKDPMWLVKTQIFHQLSPTMFHLQSRYDRNENTTDKGLDCTSSSTLLVVNGLVLVKLLHLISVETFQ